MAELQTPIKVHSLINPQEQTTAKKLKTSKNTTKHETERKKSRPKQFLKRNSYKSNLLKPNPYEMQRISRERYRYYASEMKQTEINRRRTMSTPKFLGKIKRKRERSYDQMRREQEIPPSEMTFKPFKPDHPWNRPKKQEKVYYVDSVCLKHLENSKTNYEELEKKVKKYGQKAEKRVKKEKREKKRKINKLLKNLDDLEIQQEIIRNISKKKKLKRSTSEIAKAFTWHNGFPI